MARKGILEGHHVVTDVTGLGDEKAFWGVPEPGDKYVGYQLEVFYGAGGHLLLTFHHPGGNDAALAAAKQMATLALSRL